MRGSTTFLLGLVLLPACLLAQELQPTPDYKLIEPLVSYEMHGKVQPTLHQIIATADIDISSTVDTNSHFVWIRLPNKVDAAGKGDRFVLDSILLNGAPLPLSSLLQSRQYLRIDRSSQPEGRAHVFTSFTTKYITVSNAGGTSTTHISNWYPEVVTAPLSDKPKTLGTMPSPIVANYAVELRVDSGHLLAGAGDLKNEQEHFGILPNRGDTILFDITEASLGPGPRGLTHINSYAWEARNLSMFDIALLEGGTAMDQAVAGPMRLTINNTSEPQYKWREDIATTGQRLMQYFQSKLGAPPNITIEAVWVDSLGPQTPANGLIVLSTQPRNKDVAIASLAVQLAAQYFSPTTVSPESRGLPWSDGAAIFAATEALHDIYAAKGYNMMAKYGDWQCPMNALGQPMIQHSPFAWVETIRAPRLRRSLEDSTKYEALFVVPSALHTLEPIIGNSRLWNLLREFSTRYRHRNVSPAEFVSFMTDSSRTAIMPPMFTQWQTYNRRLDWSVKDVAAQKTYSGVILSGRVERSALPWVPVELGIVVPSGDTLSKSLMPDTSSVRSKYLSFNIEVLDTPVALILDPYHYLPDENRENNVYLFGRGPVRFSSNKAETYPAFRRLERGE